MRLLVVISTLWIGLAHGGATAVPVELSDASPFWLWIFLGRLHPLVVHFPIALLISAALAEFGSRLIQGNGSVARLLRSPLDASQTTSRLGPSDIALYCLLLGAGSAALAAGLGWLNASSQDFSGASLELVSRHRIAGITTAVIACATAALALWLRTRFFDRRLDVVYLLGLSACVLGVGISGQLGGSLVFGDDYLTSALPISGESIAIRDLPSHDGVVDFVGDIKPIFEAACNECHGPDKQKGQLRLDARHLAVNGGRSGHAIVPGSGRESTLISRLLGQGVDRRMPLDADPLSPPEISLLNAWIEQGANWPDSASVADAVIAPHWAYVPPVGSAPPTVEATHWSNHPIDAFVLAKLERAGLSPSPEADRETLIRRVSLDLIGLPPSVAEVDAFLLDTSEGAYGRVVERLLASPHFGEKWASHWLDLARYADSDGFDGDNARSIWKYRDWVIDAFNQDMPFDRFTIEQIAGDMLPHATLDQRIATGFHRNTMRNREDGVDYEEAYWETLVDRVSTTSTVWLGSTIACAQCHDHKFDPFTQREYYEFLAFFGNDEVHWEEMLGLFGGSTQILKEPVLSLATPKQAQQQRRLGEQIEFLKTRVNTPTPELEAAQRDWEKQVLAVEATWTPLVADVLRSANGSTLNQLEDGSILVSGVNPRADSYTLMVAAPSAPITGLRIDALTDPSLPSGGPGRYADGEFVLTGVSAQLMRPGTRAKGRPLHFDKAQADAARRGHKAETLISQGRRKNQIKLNGWSVEADGESHRAVFQVGKPRAARSGDRLAIRLHHDRSVIGRLGLGRFRVSLTTAKDPLRNIQIPAAVLKHLATSPSERSPDANALVSAYYRKIAPSLASTRHEIAQLGRKESGLKIIDTLVMAERESGVLPSTVIREGGSYTSLGETVFAAVPSALHVLPEGRRADRLGLAHWLIADDNPLVARVTVNRIWEQIFGRGIVETTEDFGTQGAEPSHPALLDWLALKFVDLGWSYKSIQRLIVTSATYRQSSVTTPELAAADPENRWLARVSRVRLPAEHIRDVSLAVSGLLHRPIGGASVFPHQLPGVWNFAFSFEHWVTSPRPDRYRRSLYTHLKRTAPHPGLAVFDVPSREFCTARRIRTNTPLQALALLNGSDSFDSARNLGGLLASRDADVRTTVEYGFRRVLSRNPREFELNQIVDYYENELAHFLKHPKQVTEILGEGRLPEVDGSAHAAWSMLAASLLNLDETITKQ
jgi:uncharacterized membrane protein